MDTPWDEAKIKDSADILEVLGAGVVVEVKAAQTETVGEAPEYVQAVGLHEKAFGLVPDPPEARNVCVFGRGDNYHTTRTPKTKAGRGERNPTCRRRGRRRRHRKSGAMQGWASGGEAATEGGGSEHDDIHSHLPVSIQLVHACRVYHARFTKAAMEIGGGQTM